jgi:cysteine synthase
MKEWKWPAVALVGLVLAAIVVMYGLTDDPTIRAHLVGYLDSIVPFIIGAATGGTVGGVAGYVKGRYP